MSYEATCLLATAICVPNNINPIKWFYRCCCTVNPAVKALQRGRSLSEVMTPVSLGLPSERSVEGGKYCGGYELCGGLVLPSASDVS